MNLLQKITRSNFLIRSKSWEYWPFWIIHFPAFIYWLWLSLRSRSLVFFSACNPGIAMGGMFGESKYEILKKIPGQYVPTTIRVTPPTTAANLQLRLNEAGLRMPVIFKPDIGERGLMVRKVSTMREIEEYLLAIKTDFLIQKLVEWPLEFGIFYSRLPDEDKGILTSVVAKEMLFIVGDGRSTLKELIFDSDRAKLQWNNLKLSHKDLLNSVIPSGKKLELVSIGNHRLGTRFINANHLIDPNLTGIFDAIAKDISGFFFGRFDLRCASLDDLYQGKIMIMELNGCGAEPIHIYDSDFPLLKGWSTLVEHWHTIYLIARANKKRGVSHIRHRDALAFYRKFKAVTS